MRSQSYMVLSTMALAANAAPFSLFGRQETAPAAKGDGSTFTKNTAPALLPQNDPNSKARAATVAVNKAGYVYGPSLIGDAAFFLNGTLGNARVDDDMALWGLDREDIDKRVGADAQAIGAGIRANGGLKSLDDYVKVLYGGKWKNSNPRGEAPGIMTNFTQDLLFSMERLSQNPYPVELVKPGVALPFSLDDSLTTKITTTTLKALQDSGNLFVVDHRDQLRYEKTKLNPPRFGPAATAYFYIHPKSGDFLPLAIKTNVGKDLIYTPLDSENDWLLAKMMFNVNDMFHAQMFHLVVTHDVSEAVHEAALRTLSESHPVMVLLERMMLQGYSSRVVGEQLCFNPNGHWDQLFFVNNVGCRQYVTETWTTRGAFQGGYLETDLQTRGLLNEKNEYKFKNFPFYDDSKVIHDAYKNFFTSFVNSYYASDADVAKDFELQNWFIEATAGAKVQDFPKFGQANKPAGKDVLVDVLTHFGFITSVVHHALNGGDPVGSKATLPFHLNAMYAPVPEAKGVKDLLPFLPPPAEAIHYIGFIASFNRPFYEGSNRNLENAFSTGDQLKRLNAQTQTAATGFLNSMKTLSKKVRARSFDENGLSDGMPFVYRTLDPGFIPYFCAV